MKTSEKLRLLRKERAVTQEGLAEHLGVSRQTIAKWEREDEANIPLPLAVELCKFFRISLDDFVNPDLWPIQPGQSDQQSSGQPPSPEPTECEPEPVYESVVPVDFILLDSKAEPVKKFRSKKPVIAAGCLIAFLFGCLLGWQICAHRPSALNQVVPISEWNKEKIDFSGAYVVYGDYSTERTP